MAKRFLHHIQGGKLKTVSRWLRGPPLSAVLDTSDGLKSHPVCVVDQLTLDWGAVYGERTHQTQATGRVRPSVCPGDPSPPTALPPLDAADLRAVIQSKSESAAGGDRITWTLLRALPEQAWQDLTHVFWLIEDGQDWPHQLTKVVMTPIPKKGVNPGEPVRSLKTRLISLAPMLYRTWASARARHLAIHWIPNHVPAAIYRGVPGKDARLATWMEAACWDSAQMQQSEMWGLFLDFSKIYDTLDYSFLRDAMIHFGVDQRLANTLYRWQTHHSRRIAHLGWVGRSFLPANGIPQGCPLAVLQAIVCSMAWLKTLDRALPPTPQAPPTLIVFLDDWSVLATNQDTITTIAGITSVWAKDWNIQLNPSKCALARNPVAAARDTQPQELQEIPVVQAQGLLGHDAGPTPTTEQQRERERIQSALLKARRISSMGLPHWAYSKPIKTYVAPLLFGIHATPLLDGHRCLEAIIKRGSWGPARCASNWNLAQAVSIAATRLTPASFQFFEAFQVAKQATMHETHRNRLLQLWHSGRVSPRNGPWSQLLDILRETGGVLTPGGGVSWPEFRISINLHMPKMTLAHILRQVWRRYHTTKAVSKLRFLQDYQTCIDWDATRVDLPNPTRPTAHQTILAHGVNTKSRCFRHFGSGGSPLCEHQCCDENEVGLEDHPEHRLLFCKGTQNLRVRHFGEQHLAHLRAQPLCTTRCAIWTLPADAMDLLIPHERAWGLWPTEAFIQTLLAIGRPHGYLSKKPQVRFRYVKTELGAHPILKTHSATVSFSDLHMAFSASAQTQEYRKSDWECEAFVLAAIVASIWRCPIELLGLSKEKSWYLNGLATRRGANAYLLDTISQFFRFLDVSFGEMSGQERLHAPHPDPVVDPEVISFLDLQWDTAKRLVSFNSELLRAYPIAHELSRRRGLVPNPPPLVGHPVVMPRVE